MYNIPGMDIVVPGSSKEFDRLFKQGYKKNNPKYFRLTDFENKYDFDVKYGKGNLINNSSKTTIITFGPTLNFVMPVVNKYKVNLAYFTTVRPLDNKLISKVNSISKNIIIIEPFYTGSVISDSKTVKQAFQEVETALEAETASRSSADTTLQSNIDTETAARTAADTAEATARSNADNTLQSNI